MGPNVKAIDLFEQRAAGGEEPPSYLPLTTTLIETLLANEGYAMTTAEKDYSNEIEKVIKGMSGAGSYNAYAAGKIGAVFLFIGNTDECAEYDLLTASKVGTAINAPTQGSNGIVFDGATQFFKTGVIPSVFAPGGNIVVHHYNRTDLTGQTVKALSGVGNANGFADNYMGVRKSGSAVNSDTINSEDPFAYVTFAENALNQGVTYGRVDNTKAFRMLHGTYAESASTYGGALPNDEIILGALQNYGTQIWFTNCNLPSCIIAKNLTQAQIEQIHNGDAAAQLIRGTNV